MHPSVQQAQDHYRRQACVTRQSFEALEGAEAVERELLDTPLGMKLVELLTLAQDVDHVAACKENEHVLNHRRYLYRPTMEARLAEKLLDLLGPPENCTPVRELAERAVS